MRMLRLPKLPRARRMLGEKTNDLFRRWGAPAAYAISIPVSSRQCGVRTYLKRSGKSHQ
jgi:hypothetical protein